jgi:methyl-accepting chemotaxis protein
MNDTILLVFTGILAVAVLLQSLMFFGIYKSIRQLNRSMDSMGKDLLRNVEVISSKVDEGLTSIKEIGDSLKPVIQKVASATEIIHKRVEDIDAFLSETTDTARMEILRLRDKIEAASNRAEEVLEMIQNCILLPISEMGAVARGIKAGIDALFRKRRNPSRSAAQDEEMFI